ncbi:MAG: phosphoribosyltransferase family protein [Planctomycetaceae bacterium]|nr:phosphoribosyltransferase family protein [Planctomycetaceae bacterium]
MYEEALKTAIVHSKQSFSSAAMMAVGQLLVSRQRQWLAELSVDRILPIPQAWLTRFRRNFNPADVIARCVGHSLRVPVDPHILRRRRGWQSPQKAVPLARRYENQRNSFRLRDARVIAGQCVLLVDDVLTTGATCSEAARLLKAAGAKEVHVLVAARVADH